MMDDKKTLRQRFKALRDQASAEDRQSWSRAVCGHIEAFCLSRRIHRLGLFWPFGSEIDLRFLMQAHPDWFFFFPRVASSSPPRLAWGTEPMEPGQWGLMEPVDARHFLPPVQLLVVPGLAFDAKGFRLGYGKGFYDALLDKLDDRMIALGACFECQRKAELPISPQDMPVQGLMTEKGLCWFAEDGEERDSR